MFCESDDYTLCTLNVTCLNYVQQWFRLHIWNYIYFWLRPTFLPLFLRGSLFSASIMDISTFVFWHVGDTKTWFDFWFDFVLWVLSTLPWPIVCLHGCMSTLFEKMGVYDYMCKVINWKPFTTTLIMSINTLNKEKYRITMMVSSNLSTLSSLSLLLSPSLNVEYL